MMKKRIAKILMCFGITVVLTACGSNGVALEKRGSLDDNNSFEKNSNSENEIEFSEENSDQQQETSYGLEEDRLGDDYTLVDEKNSNTVGNSSMNIINGGEIAYQDGWYYYNNGKGIYKAREDGSEREQVIGETGDSLNVVGDWMYYRNNDGIRKAKIDGSVVWSINSEGYELNVVDGWIYFYVVDSGLYKMKTDETEKELLVSGWAMPNINVDDGEWIYYFYMNGNPNGIYKLK